MPYGYGAANYLQFPNDLTTNKDYAGNYILFTAMKVTGGVDTRTLKFNMAEGDPYQRGTPYSSRVNFWLSK